MRVVDQTRPSPRPQPKLPPPVGAARWAWRAALGLGLAAALVCLLLPPRPWVVLNSTIQVLGLVAIAAGVRWHRPSTRVAWWLILAGKAVWVAAGAYWNVYSVRH